MFSIIVLIAHCSIWPSVVFTLVTYHFTYYSSSISPKPQKPKEKQRRVWAMGGSKAEELDYSHPSDNGTQKAGDQGPDAHIESVRDAHKHHRFFLQSF